MCVSIACVPGAHRDRINLIIEQLKKKNNLTEEMKNTDQLYWVSSLKEKFNKIKPKGHSSPLPPEIKSYKESRF